MQFVALDAFEAFAASKHGDAEPAPTEVSVEVELTEVLVEVELTEVLVEVVLVVELVKLPSTTYVYTLNCHPWKVSSSRSQAALVFRHVPRHSTQGLAS